MSSRSVLRTNRTLLAAGAVLGLTVCLLPLKRAAAQPAATQPATTLQPATTSPASQPDVYDTKAEAKVQIADALVKAQRENQRVLVVYGANWCPWCRKLHGTFKDNKDVAKVLRDEYQVVLVDVGRFDRQMDIAEKYGADLKKSGIPYLTVLAADGKVLANEESGVLEAGERHDPVKVVTLLKRWAAEPRDAEKLLAETLTRATAEQKAVLLHFGAPWCIWCRRLDEFLARKEIADLIGRDFVELKLDVDRMTHAREVFGRYRKDSDKAGLPWMAILGADGKALATSDAAGDNIGYPAAAVEIEHFMGMLKKGARRLTAEQLAQLQKALEEAGAKLRAPASQPGH